jgi:hypothetical protein
MGEEILITTRSTNWLESFQQGVELFRAHTSEGHGHGVTGTYCLVSLPRRKKKREGGGVVKKVVTTTSSPA